jgi:hypothetical protein
MTQLPPIDSLLATIVLATLAIGLPIVMVLAIWFLLERRVNLGRSKELEKLIWQLHRIASALEHQMNLTFPAVQPGTEERGDRVYRQQPVIQAQMAAAPVNSQAASPAAAQAAAPAAPQAGAPAAPQAGAPAAPQAGAHEAATSQPGAPQVTAPAPAPGQRRPSSPDAPHARVNSMFGFDK